MSFPATVPSSLPLTQVYRTISLHYKSNLNSGGAIEIQDGIFPMACDDDSMTDDCAIKKWSDLMYQGFASYGARVDSALSYPKQLAEAGFVDIVTVEEKWPTNRWPKHKKYKQIGKNFLDQSWLLVLGLWFLRRNKLT